MINPLTKKNIDNIFKEAETQVEYLTRLYRIAVPNLDEIDHIDGYPKVSTGTNDYLFRKAIAFDKQHHPEVFSGGLWMNCGFGKDEDLDDWQVTVGEAQLIY